MEVHDYQKALDKLKGLVVQRLFEIMKMGLAGTSTCLNPFIYNTDSYRYQDISWEYT